jgi:hypothetical protein
MADVSCPSCLKAIHAEINGDMRISVTVDEVVFKQEA